ncbi:MAG: hypothetical protein RL748_2127 [Pseudomonadota bacterium]|jgi:hypothetical protein
MRFILFCFLALTLAGCATVDFQPYEGKNNLYEGQGGTKVVVTGIDFWANGSPPRKYSIIGMVASEIGNGIGDESMIRSAVAREVKKQGGDAAIQITNNSSFAGVVNAAPGFYMAVEVRRMQFAVVRYVN